MDQPFSIFQLTLEEAKEISASPDEPHKHDFEELIVGIDGKLEHFIDFMSSTIEAPLVSFVTQGKLHRVIPLSSENKFKMWVIRFRNDFIPETTFQLYSYYHAHATIKMKKDKYFSRLVRICEMMFFEMQESTPDLPVIRHLLSTLFSMIESEQKKNGSDKQDFHDTQNITFRNFLKILEDNYKRPEGVEFYAEKLFMSGRNLNLICHNILQKSVSEIIELRKLIEAKNLLINSDKTVSEIGYELGYNEKSYFTTVFKKKSGHTPTEFREEMKKLVS